MESLTARVVEVRHSWCSCGCCVPYGEGNGIQSEAPADMHEVVLTNGETVELGGGGVSEGLEVRYNPETKDWY